jgi:hypothetical protein
MKCTFCFEILEMDEDECGCKELLEDFYKELDAAPEGNDFEGGLVVAVDDVEAREDRYAKDN